VNCVVTGTSSTGKPIISYDSSGALHLTIYCQIYASGVAVDRHRNIYATGQSSNADYLTVKFDSAGGQKWAATYDGPGHGTDQAVAIAVDTLGNAYVTGYCWIAAYDEAYATAKYDSAGTQKWVTLYNDPAHGIDHATALALDSSGNTIVTGYYTLASDYDFMTIKYDSAGNQVWAVPYQGTPGDNVACAVAVGESNSVYVAGTSNGGTTNYDMVLVKYDSSGARQWVCRYNGPDIPHEDHASGLALDGTGGAYVCGSTSDAPSGSDDFALVRVSAQGQVAWMRRMLFGTASAVVADTSGNAYVTGPYYDGSNWYTLVQKYDTSGIGEWSATLGSDRASAIALGPDGGVFITRPVFQYYEHGVDFYDYLTTRLSQLTGVIEQQDSGLPARRDVSCIPNPCNGSATIRYSVATLSPVQLTVSDVSGRVVSTLVRRQQNAGEHSARWSGLTDSGRRLPDGVYICRLVTNRATSTSRLLLLRSR
jgi:hypothetical protein